MANAFKVEHNLKSLYFFIRMADNTKSVLEYKKLPNAVLEMYHTVVPAQHRGHGLAEKLTKEAFKYCLTNNYKVLPTCTYVAKYSRELATPDEKKIVVESL